MADVVYSLYEAKSLLSQLVERAARGEEIIIAKAGKPMAKLVPMLHRRKQRQPGAWKGKVVIAANFDASLPKAIRRAFEGDESRITSPQSAR